MRMSPGVTELGARPDGSARPSGHFVLFEDVFIPHILFLVFVFVWVEDPRLNVNFYHFYLNEISDFTLSLLLLAVVLFVVY